MDWETIIQFMTDVFKACGVPEKMQKSVRKFWRNQIEEELSHTE
jgi:hypothetical protein